MGGCSFHFSRMPLALVLCFPNAIMCSGSGGDAVFLTPNGVCFSGFFHQPPFLFFFSIRLFFTAARMCSVYVLYWSLCLVGPLVANKRAVRYSRWERKWNVESYSSFVWPRRCVARNDIFLNRYVCRRPTKTNFARIEFYAMFFRPLAKTMSWHSP